MKRKSNDQPLADVIDHLLHQYGLSAKYREFKLLQSWAELMGPMVAKRTDEVYIRDGVLFVKLNSASLRNELSYNRSKMVELLNEAAGKQIIHDIQFK
ncbi:MAG: DUF721 domain-containing protein [Bacteroidia bacterium]|nr:DUF721 domain-containing protein [Bacteroidia bacterium]MCC6769018.1 DUF721 domain-containing protein [Bacteroidia bacterium]